MGQGYGQEDWQSVIDLIVLHEARPGGMDPTSAISLLALVEQASDGVPRARCCELLFAAAITRLSPCFEPVFDTEPEPPSCANPLYCCSRSLLLRADVGLAPGLAEVATTTCVQLHFGERRAVSDGLLALSLLHSDGEPPALTQGVSRFESQAKRYLGIMNEAFPDSYVTRMRNWTDGRFSDGGREG